MENLLELRFFSVNYTVRIFKKLYINLCDLSFLNEWKYSRICIRKRPYHLWIGLHTFSDKTDRNLNYVLCSWYRKELVISIFLQDASYPTSQIGRLFWAQVLIEVLENTVEDLTREGWEGRGEQGTVVAYSVSPVKSRPRKSMYHVLRFFPPRQFLFLLLEHW